MVKIDNVTDIDHQTLTDRIKNKLAILPSVPWLVSTKKRV